MYNAFISYSHATDGKLAPALQTALEKFAKPWYKLRSLNIFRDESSLSASPHLWSNITRALDQSEYFIYLASPKSASSKWVNLEIEYWLTHKSLETVLIALTDGIISWDHENDVLKNHDSNSLPTILSKSFTSEPFFIDLRTSKSEEDVTLNNPIFKKEVLKLAAHLHGKEPKDMASEEVKTHKKMLIVRNGAIMLLLLFLIISIYQTNEAKQQTKNALKQTEIAKEQAKIANEKTLEAQLSDSLTQVQTKIALEEKNNALIQEQRAIDEKNNALEQERIAIAEKKKAQANYLISQAKSQVNKDQTLALQLALAATEIMPDDKAIKSTIATIYRDFIPYEIINHRSYIGNVMYSPLGDKIITSSQNFVSIWDMTGKLIKEFNVGRSIISMDISPDGDQIITGLQIQSQSETETASLWDLDGILVRKFEGQKGYIGDINSVAFSPDKTKIISGSYKANMYSIDGAALPFQTMQNNITNIAFSSDNNQLLTSDFSNDAWLWETNGIFLRKFEGHNSVISALAFSPDNTKILTGSRDQTVRLWPIKEGEAQIYNATNTVFDVAFSPDSNQIAYTSGNVVELIDLSGQKPKILSGHSDKVTSLAFSIDGKQILTGSFDGTARIWTLNKGELIQEIKSTTKRPHLVSFSSDGNHIVTQLEEYRQFKSENVSKQYWTLDGENISHLMENLNNPNSLLYQSGNELKSYIELHQVSSVGVSSDKKLILTGDEKGSIYLWGSNGLKIKEFSGNNGEIHTLQFSPNNALILTGDYQGAARLFDLNGNVKKISLGSSNSDSILSVKFSSDGQTVLAGSRGGDVGLFDLQGELIKRFTFFEDGGAQNLRPVKYSPVIFSPNGKLILTGSTNNTVRLWNLEGQIVHEYHGHKDFINDAAFSSDGSMIVTASVDGVIRIWRAPKDLESFLKNQKIGPLSLTQKKFYDID